MSDEQERRYPKGRTMDSRENDCIALAMDLVERHLMEGTASSQEITHFLKLGSSKERLEKEVLESKCALLEAQVESLKAAAYRDEMVAAAIEAMTSYQPDYDEDEDYDDYESFDED